MAVALLFAVGAASVLLASVNGADGNPAAAPSTPQPVVPERMSPRVPRLRAALPGTEEVAPPEIEPPPPAPAPERGPWHLTILGPDDAPFPGVEVRGPKDTGTLRTGDDGAVVLPWAEDADELQIHLSGPVPSESVDLTRRDTVLRIADLLGLTVDLVDAETGAAIGGGDVSIHEPAEQPPRPVEFLGGGRFRFPRGAARPGMWTSISLSIDVPRGWAGALWHDRYLSEPISPVATSLHRTVALRRETVYEIEVVDPDGNPWAGDFEASVRSGYAWTAAPERTGVPNVWTLHGAARLRGEPTTISVVPGDTWGAATVAVPEDAAGPVRVELARYRRRVLRCGGCGGCSSIWDDAGALATTGSTRVEVVVRTTDGRTARGVTVRAERALERVTGENEWTLEEQAATKTADADGRVVFENVEAGDLEIVAFAPGFAWTSVKTAVGGDRLRVDVAEDASPAALLRVEDADGRPIAGARIEVDRFRDDAWASLVDGVQEIEPVTGPGGAARLPKIGGLPVDVTVTFGSRTARARDVAAGDRVLLRLPALSDD